MRSGIFLIDKPAGVTSAGVVGRVKRTLKAEKVGHAGTLDPDATGLLMVLVNGATKVASFAADGMKRYSGVMQLGVTTSTDDLAGEVLSVNAAVPEFSTILNQSKNFVGTISQVPPRVSAIKVGGKRAHKLVRQGEQFELKARSVEVYRFDISPLDGGKVSYLVECSPGTYVRSLARDLGEACGCGGAVESIRREASGGFSLEGSISLEDISWDRLQNWTQLLPGLPIVRLSDSRCFDLLNGRQGALREVSLIEEVAKLPVDSLLAYGCEGRVESLGLLRKTSSGDVVIQVNLERALS
jgi:tRNA pseudouridine55 synthase